MRSSDEVEYEQRLGLFRGTCIDCSVFYDYVHEQWLNSHKEKFVDAWTNRVMHLGNTTTSRYDMFEIIYIKYDLLQCIITDFW